MSIANPVLLCDLDGVIRNFDRVERALREIEVRHSLAANGLLSVAFEPELLTSVVTGKSTHPEWIERVRTILTEHHSRVVADELVGCWSSDFGEVNSDVHRLLGELRSQGWRVILVTNATTRLESDLDYLGIRDVLDDIVNSSAIGYRKPDSRYYEHALKVAGQPASECLFVDDRLGNVEAARKCGIDAVLFTQAKDIRDAAKSLLSAQA